ncbi:alpha/beta hydrolase [Marinifilum caeruleilacunae]|uniref:Alpha/beta hydrolase n=1 Tax=Marinifilum caeruleilacunae TaxID=2499076 RepID=A0ABX1WZJ5_9BACT|nr:alpha/beta hydrolase [Marinifilum caeruleilacunae]NOU61590.1 alpha/beta hydrolase [Marinifilum caeruleilacunae]
MQHKIFHLQSSDQTQLFAQEFLPTQNIKAVIVLVHGIGEHSSRYLHWAERFVNKGFALLTYDQKGHGLSEGKRGVISSYNDFMNDIDLLLKNAEEKYPDLPLILYGHSMGGGEVLNHLLRRNGNYKGVISTSPWIISQAAPPKFVIPLLRLFNALIPKFSIKTKFDSSLLSHDAEVCKKYDEDEFVHHWVSLRLFVDAYDAGYFVNNSQEKIKKPLLLMHGDEDEITDSAASKFFADKNQENCTFKLWKNAYHELHNETCNQEVFDYICNWINQLLKK